MKEIDERLSDSTWDLTIAHAVIGRRKRHDRLVLASGTLLSASLLVVSLAFFFQGASGDPIDQQVSGIYEKQYADSDSLTGDQTDTLLIEILAMR